jgi:hypothetical protein
MKLAKRIATISAAATAAILFSAGGAQAAQTDGGLIALLGNLPLLHLADQAGSAGQGQKAGNSETTTNNNVNTNGVGPNNNNNNNNNGGGGPNNNNNNNNGDTQTQGGGGGLFPLLGGPLINFQVCYTKGQDGSGNTFTGNQNINCHQS